VLVAHLCIAGAEHKVVVAVRVAEHRAVVAARVADTVVASPVVRLAHTVVAGSPYDNFHTPPASSAEPGPILLLVSSSGFYSIREYL